MLVVVVDGGDDQDFRCYPFCVVDDIVHCGCNCSEDDNCLLSSKSLS